MTSDVAPTVLLSQCFQGNRPWVPLASVSSALKWSPELEKFGSIFPALKFFDSHSFHLFLWRESDGYYIG